MKRILVMSAVFALLLFAGGNAAFAGDRVDIAVSCTIPVIPGVNAPYLEQQVVLADTTPRPSDNASSLQEDQQGQSSPLIEEETKDKDVTNEGEKEMVLVKTFYVR
jgi:hypothetical protein